MEKRQTKRLRPGSQIIEQVLKAGKIDEDDIAFAAVVFYPIAVIELETCERRTDEFEYIQWSILNLIKLGFNVSEISIMLGLRERYVSHIFTLFLGEGLIDDRGLITGLGDESLEASTEERRVKYSRVNSKVSVQMDVLNKQLITKEHLISNNELLNKDEVNIWGCVIAGSDGLYEDDLIRLEDEIEASGYEQFLGSKVQEVLQKNVEAITGVDCIHLKYVKACLVMLKATADFVAFFPHQVSRQNEKFTRWAPISVTSEAMLDIFKGGNLKVYTECNKYYDKTLQLIENHFKQQVGEKNREQFVQERLLQNYYIKVDTNLINFDSWEHVFSISPNSLIKMSQQLDDDMEQKYGYRNLLKILLEINRKGASYIVDEFIPGMIFKIVTSDDRLLHVTSVMDQMLSKKDESGNNTHSLREINSSLVNYDQSADQPADSDITLCDMLENVLKGMQERVNE